MSAVASITDRFPELAADQGRSNQTFTLLRATGAGAVRFPVRWDEVEQDNGSKDWGPFEDLYSQLIFTGFSAIPVILGCPASWYAAGQAQQDTTNLSYPTGHQALNSFADFVLDTISFFSLYGPAVQAVEIWSQPNASAGSAISDPVAFSRLLATAAAAIDSAQAAGFLSTPVTVISGALRVGAGEDWRSYLSAFQKQHSPYEVGVQPVTATGSAGSSMAYSTSLAKQVEQIISDVAGATRSPLWICDLSASSESPWGEDGQASALAQATAQLLKRPDVRGISVSRLFPDPSGSDDTSLVRADSSEKPAVGTLRTAWAGR